MQPARTLLPRFLLALAITGVWVVPAKTERPWHSSLEEARQEALRTHRLLLLHFWSESCGPCMQLEARVLSQPRCRQVLQLHYVPVKIHVGEHPELAQQFGVDRIPTDIIMRPTGEELYRSVSPSDLNRYLAMLQQVAAHAYAGQTPGPLSAHTSPPSQPVGRQAMSQPPVSAGHPPVPSVAATAGGPAAAAAVAQNTASPPTASTLRPLGEPTTGGIPQNTNARPERLETSVRVAPASPESPPGAAWIDNPYLRGRGASVPVAAGGATPSGQPLDLPTANPRSASAGAIAAPDASPSGTASVSAINTPHGAANFPQTVPPGVSHQQPVDVQPLAAPPLAPSRYAGPSRYSEPLTGAQGQPASSAADASLSRNSVSARGSLATGSSRYSDAARAQEPPNSTVVVGATAPAAGSTVTATQAEAISVSFGQPAPSPAAAGVTRDGVPTGATAPRPQQRPQQLMSAAPAEQPLGTARPTASPVQYSLSAPPRWAEAGLANGPVPAAAAGQPATVTQPSSNSVAWGNPAATAAPPGLEGYCPVSLVEESVWRSGNPQWMTSYEGRIYFFASPEKLERFRSNPQRYAPVLGGFDVVRYRDQNLMVAGKREHGLVYGDRYYLFADEESLQQFWQNPSRYIAPANSTASPRGR